jgi:hypothetical protein
MKLYAKALGLNEVLRRKSYKASYSYSHSHSSY